MGETEQKLAVQSVLMDNREHFCCGDGGEEYWKIRGGHAIITTVLMLNGTK